MRLSDCDLEFALACSRLYLALNPAITGLIKTSKLFSRKNSKESFV